MWPWGGRGLSHPCESISSRPRLCQPCLSPRRVFRGSFMSRLSLQKPTAPWMGTEVVWPQILPSQGAGDAEWRAEDPLPPALEAPTLCPRAQGSDASPKSLFCSAESSQGLRCVHGLQKLSTLDDRCAVAWKHRLFGKKPGISTIPLGKLSQTSTN